MPTDEQRKREAIAYQSGYDSRNMEVQALREALEKIYGIELGYTKNDSAMLRMMKLRDALAQTQDLAMSALGSVKG